MDEATFLEQLKKSLAMSGFSGLLGAQPQRCANGEAELIIRLRSELTQHHGYAHGAVIGAAADNACAWAAASLAGDVVTANYTLHFLAPAKGEQLRARAEVIKAGRRQLTVRADIFAETGTESRLVAAAIASIARVES